MRRLVALVAALASFGIALAQPAEPRNLAELLDPIRVEHKLPALGGAIITTDGLVAIGTVGVRRAGHDEPVTNDDLWHLGSCTKAMTATLIARLVEQGKLKWTTTLADAFPELAKNAESMDAGWRGVTLEQLLANRGGASKDLDRDGLWSKLWRHKGTPTEARRILLQGVVKHAPEYEPASKFLYSNTNFAIAGHVAETITKAPWEDLMQREVFAPLGITTAGFGAPGTAAREGAGTDQPRGHSLGVPMEPGPRSDNPVAIGPAGIVHMSLADWGRFVAAHLRGARGEPVTSADGSPFLSGESWAKLHTPPADGYALGWGVSTRPWAKGEQPESAGRVLTHNGSNTMWFCVAWLAPERGFAVLVTTNTGASGARATDDAASALIRYHVRPAR